MLDKINPFKWRNAARWFQLNFRGAVPETLNRVSMERFGVSLATVESLALEEAEAFKLESAKAHESLLTKLSELDALTRAAAQRRVDDEQRQAGLINEIGRLRNVTRNLSEQVKDHPEELAAIKAELADLLAAAHGRSGGDPVTLGKIELALNWIVCAPARLEGLMTALSDSKAELHRLEAELKALK